MPWISGASASRAGSAKPLRVQDFVAMVDQFMEQLGIASAPLVGHSMGGTVSLMVAIQHPPARREGGGGRLAHRRLFALLPAQAVRAATGGICGATTTCGCCASAFACWRLFTQRDPRWADMMDRDLSRTTLESFLVSIASLRRTDLRPQLSQVTAAGHGHVRRPGYRRRPAPVAAHAAGHPARPDRALHTAGHFIMLDDPEKFTATLIRIS